ncbi:hypothetical protein BGW36DRAFT_353422 [Talaromyces proteolyticus]|uniref:Uncharacterized protein n=1 Tax=Talaromyces proteolyticus TaxID=1131652 RepID=A0AAD4L305_9EURO|nr:uncharacterized protein BGW36DRAFT_353422 [Talaromyces proteolyticus]KAH8704992.1 hypothetical protein BGW36DRAFT_353422 [Talaromyces proteolyticus]
MRFPAFSSPPSISSLPLSLFLPLSETFILATFIGYSIDILQISTMSSTDVTNNLSVATLNDSQHASAGSSKAGGRKPNGGGGRRPGKGGPGKGGPGNDSKVKKHRKWCNICRRQGHDTLECWHLPGTRRRLGLELLDSLVTIAFKTSQGNLALASQGILDHPPPPAQHGGPAYQARDPRPAQQDQNPSPRPPNSRARRDERRRLNFEQRLLERQPQEPQLGSQQQLQPQQPQQELESQRQQPQQQQQELESQRQLEPQTMELEISPPSEGQWSDEVELREQRKANASQF